MQCKVLTNWVAVDVEVLLWDNYLLYHQNPLLATSHVYIKLFVFCMKYECENVFISHLLLSYVDYHKLNFTLISLRWGMSSQSRNPGFLMWCCSHYYSPPERRPFMSRRYGNDATACASNYFLMHYHQFQISLLPVPMLGKSVSSQSGLSMGQSCFWSSPRGRLTSQVSLHAERKYTVCDRSVSDATYTPQCIVLRC